MYDFPVLTIFLLELLANGWRQENSSGYGEESWRHLLEMYSLLRGGAELVYIKIFNVFQLLQRNVH